VQPSQNEELSERVKEGRGSCSGPRTSVPFWLFEVGALSSKGNCRPKSESTAIGRIAEAFALLCYWLLETEVPCAESVDKCRRSICVWDPWTCLYALMYIIITFARITHLFTVFFFLGPYIPSWPIPTLSSWTCYLNYFSSCACGLGLLKFTARNPRINDAM